MICMIGVKKAQGFTLLELLVATSLLVIVMSVLARIFVSFYQLQRKVANQAAIAEEMRFTMEYLVRQTRQDSIVYPTLPTALGSKLNQISLVTGNNTPVLIGIPPNPAASCQGAVAGINCLALSNDGGATWTPITGSRTNVTRFDVYVRPLTDPFQQTAGGYDNNIQPSVTYSISMTYDAINPSDNITLNAQTAVTLREYVR